MMNNYMPSDTIAAVATAAGTGAIAVVRISGDNALAILEKIFAKRPPYKSRHLYYGTIMLNGHVVDDGMAVYMQGPRTYTGEDSVEIYCHGGMMTTRHVLEAALHAGCRMADAGEFTKRAFLNGRLDLSQSEAVCDLITANTKNAADVALSQLSGRLKKRIDAACHTLISFIAKVEVTVDYPEEDIEEETAKEIILGIDEQIHQLDDLLRTADAGQIYREGVRVAIIGRPNVGKSSLLNALLGENRAIVTEVAGTTRDTLEAHIDIGGLAVTVTDTAGLHTSQDAIERMGIERAKAAMERSQLTLFVVDTSAELDDEDHALYDEIQHRPHIVILNKTDLPSPQALDNAFHNAPKVALSALTGEGLEDLEHTILETVAQQAIAPSEAVLSNVRHIDAVRRARTHLQTAKDTLVHQMPIDMATTDLRSALHALGEVTGVSVDDDVIDNIFKNFCVGK